MPTANQGLLYRFEVPRASFLTLRFAEPRAYSRFFNGESVFFFFRAVRFDAFRSSLLKLDVLAIRPFDLMNHRVLQARSSCAYFSTSFFNPKRGNCTVIFASSPSPSR
jgi:hypothetical protein